VISQENVKHIAKLARLGITDEETVKLQKDLTAILDFIGKLSEVNVDNIEPTAQATGLSNVWRTDEKIKRNEESRERLLDNAPETKDGYIKVKAVFD